jgi:hypothetical protein
VNSSPLKDARLRIELDTQEAQARLDKLEHKMEEINVQIQKDATTAQANVTKSNAATRQRHAQKGLSDPSSDNTGPGKFGIRQIPQLLSAGELAGVVGGPFGGAARMAVNLQQQYGAFAEGLQEGIIDQMPLPTMMKAAMKAQIAVTQTQIRKFVTEVDLRLKNVLPAFDRTLEMVKAQLLTGGHVNAKAVGKFAATSYEWEFLNARKDKDIRDKTLKLLGEQAPGVMKELFMKATEGKFSP